MKFSIEYFFCKCDQICRKLRIWFWSHLLKESLMRNFIFYVVKMYLESIFTLHILITQEHSPIIATKVHKLSN